MPYQVPKANHPWRQYQKTAPTEEKEQSHARALQIVVHELCDNWNHIEVTTVSGTRKYLYELPQNKQAIWLINFIKRSYIQY